MAKSFKVPEVNPDEELKEYMNGSGEEGDGSELCISEKQLPEVAEWNVGKDYEITLTAHLHDLEEGSGDIIGRFEITDFINAKETSANSTKTDKKPEVESPKKQQDKEINYSEDLTNEN